MAAGFTGFQNDGILHDFPRFLICIAYISMIMAKDIYEKYNSWAAVDYVKSCHCCGLPQMSRKKTMVM